MPEIKSADLTPIRLLVWLIAGGATLVVVLLLAVAGYQLYGALKTENGLTVRAYQEWTAAKADHAGIIAIAGQCPAVAPASIPTPVHPLAVPVPAALTTIVPDGWHDPAVPTPTPTPAPASDPALTLEAPSYLLAAVVLSNDIGRTRVEVAGDAARDNIWMQVFEWAMVLVGAVTTVLVSLKSLAAEQPGMMTAIGVGAIVFSALGTSIAAVNSFYSPRTTYEHDQHVLADLRSLHLQLAAGVAREGNLCAPWQGYRDWRFTRIKALAAQYAAIADTSARTGNLPPDDDDDTQTLQTGPGNNSKPGNGVKGTRSASD